MRRGWWLGQEGGGPQVTDRGNNKVPHHSTRIPTAAETFNIIDDLQMTARREILIRTATECRQVEGVAKIIQRCPPRRFGDGAIPHLLRF